jgi:hypothetical protein
MRGLLYLTLAGLLFFAPVSFAEAASYSVTTSGTQRDTTVVFNGFSSQSAFITIMDNGVVVGTISANLLGSFTKTLTNQSPGSHSFSIMATDIDSRSTPQYSFVISLQPFAETNISNILLPTTIEAQASSHVNLFGSATPNTEITIFVHSNPFTETFNSGWNGIWNHPIAGALDPGSHTVYGRVSTQGGLQSIASNTVNFEVSCKVSDIDCSSRVDMVDFSILMYYWGTSSSQADINADGIVDLTDFSILMFYWDG